MPIGATSSVGYVRTINPTSAVSSPPISTQPSDSLLCRQFRRCAVFPKVVLSAEFHQVD